MGVSLYSCRLPLTWQINLSVIIHYIREHSSFSSRTVQMLYMYIGKYCSSHYRVTGIVVTQGTKQSGLKFSSLLMNLQTSGKWHHKCIQKCSSMQSYPHIGSFHSKLKCLWNREYCVNGWAIYSLIVQECSDMAHISHSIRIMYTGTKFNFTRLITIQRKWPRFVQYSNSIHCLADCTAV